jgi:hypothetical protein
MTSQRLSAVSAAGIVLLLGFAAPAGAGTCLPVKAKGVAPKLATAQAYAQADLKQTAKFLGGKVTQMSMNCQPNPSGYRCKIDAVVCPKKK